MRDARIEQPKSARELEQETIILQDLLEREKLKRAEEIFTNRLVFTGIIFVIFFLILCVKLEYASQWVQWVFFILLIGGASISLGLMSNSYRREQDNIRKVMNNLKELLQQKRYDHHDILRIFSLNYRRKEDSWL